MRNIIIAVLAVFISACGSYNFVATKAPNEIVTLDYTTQSPSGSKTWRLINDNLRVEMTSKSNSGQVISQKAIQSNYKEFERIITSLEKAKFSESKSISLNSSAQANETLVIETHAKTYTFTQNSTTQFPPEIQKVTAYITRIFSM